MGWSRFEGSFFRHPKAVAAGRDGRDLYLAALCYATESETDGFVPGQLLPALASEAGVPLRGVGAATAALCGVGLWEPTDGGYRIHDYLDYNPSREKVRGQRQRSADRVAGWRSSHRTAVRGQDSNADVTPLQTRTNGVRERDGNGVTHPFQNRSGNGPVTGATLRDDLEYEATDEIATPVGTHVSQPATSRARQAETSAATEPAAVPNPEPAPSASYVPDAADGVEPCLEPPAALTVDQVAALYRDHTATEPGSYERSKFRAMLGLSPPPDEPELCAALRRAYDRATNGRYASYAFGVLKATRLEGTF